MIFIEPLIDLRQLRIENLKVRIFEIKLLMVWSLLQLIIIFSSMLLENL